MSRVGNVPINSIYGDTGTVDATWQKDLNQVGNDPYLKVSTNSGELNLFQQFQLSDNFYDSRFEETYVTQNSAGTGNQLALGSLQFNTMGWTRVDRMYLQIPVVFNYVASSAYTGTVWNGTGFVSWPAINGNWTTAAHTKDVDLQECWQEMVAPQSSTAQNFKTTDFLTMEKWIANFTQPDFALMHIFNRIAIYMGNNNQPVGRTQSFFLEGLKTQLREYPWTQNSMKLLSQWGLPVSNLVNQWGQETYSTPYNAVDGRGPEITPSGFLNPEMDNIPSDWIKQWVALLNKVMPSRCGMVMQPLQTTGTVTGAYTQAQLQLTLPLGMVNNFFRHKTYLPPDMKFKIDIEGTPQTMGTYGASNNINFNCPIVCINNMSLPAPAAAWTLGSQLYTQLPCTTAFTAGINFSGIRCVYQQQTLRQPLQSMINERWLSYPIVYNYETFEQYDVDNSGQASGTMIVRDIAISQQRPTELIFQIVDTATQVKTFKTNSGWGNTNFWINDPSSNRMQATLGTGIVPFTLNSTANASPAIAGQYAVGSTAWFTSLCDPNNPCTVTGALSQKGVPGYGSAWQNGATAFSINGTFPLTYNQTYPVITTISTLIGGRTQYYYKNDTYTAYTYGTQPMNAYDVLIAEQDEECYKDYSTHPAALKTPIEYSSISGTGAFQRITIAPGGYANTADIPTDLGASVIRVQVTLTAPLPNNKKLQIVKKMPEQIALDTNKNCTLIMYVVYFKYLLISHDTPTIIYSYLF